MAAIQMACRLLMCLTTRERYTRAVGFLWGCGQGPAVVLRWLWEGHRTGGSLTSCGWCSLHLSGGCTLELGARAQQQQGQGSAGMMLAWGRVWGDKIQGEIHFHWQVGHSPILTSFVIFLSLNQETLKAFFLVVLVTQRRQPRLAFWMVKHA